MKKMMKRLFSFVLALALILGSMTFNVIKASADEEYDIFVAFGGDAAESGDWGYGYAGGEVTGAITATDSKISVGGTTRIGLEFAEPVVYTWYTAPTIVAPGMKTADFSVKTFIDGVEVATDLTAGDNWWYEGTGDYDAETSMRIAGGYNEWGTKYIAEAPTGYTKLEYEVTCNALSTEAEVTPIEYIVPTMDMAETTAQLCFADNNWTYQYWGGAPEGGVAANNAVIPANGFGRYTVSLDFTGVDVGMSPDCAFFDLQIVNGQALYGKPVVQIDDVKINGASVTLAGEPYTSSDDGVETRVNLYNAWVSEPPADARTASGSLDNATPVPVSAEDLVNIQTIEVTFTLIPETQAYITWVNSDWSVSNWSAAGDAENIHVEPVTVYGPGEYSTKISFDEPIDGIAFAALMMDRGETMLPYIIMDVTDIKINGESAEFSKGYTTYDNDGSYQTRVNLYNEWVTELPADVRTADGSTDVSTKMIANDITGVSSVEVFFTVSQGAFPVIEEDEPKEPVVYGGDYHAYLQVQTNTDLWIFRNGWDDATYGLGTPEFDGGLYSTTSLEHYPGIFGDVTITGDGTYTVSLTGADFQSENHFSIMGISTDIPYGGDATYTNVIVKVNGKEMYTFEQGLVNKENKNYDSLLLQSDWNNDVKNLFEPMFPVDSIEVTFTVSGLGYEAAAVAADTPEVIAAPEETPAPTEAPAATEAPKTEEKADISTDTAKSADTAPVTDGATEESSSNVGLIVGICAAVVVIAGAVVLVIRKKK